MQLTVPITASIIGIEVYTGKSVRVIRENGSSRVIDMDASEEDIKLLSRAGIEVEKPSDGGRLRR